MSSVEQLLAARMADAPTIEVNLIVLTPGKSNGKIIPITANSFEIGRDPSCQLRPTSVLISKRHCALAIRGSRVFVVDHNSLNGTFVSGVRVVGETELLNDSCIQVGPLLFGVRVVRHTSMARPAPPPVTKEAFPIFSEGAVASILRSPDDSDSSQNRPLKKDCFGVPMGDTDERPSLGPANVPSRADDPAPADTAGIAQSILTRFLREKSNRRQC
jgi:hypothetical protein